MIANTTENNNESNPRPTSAAIDIRVTTGRKKLADRHLYLDRINIIYFKYSFAHIKMMCEHR